MLETEKIHLHNSLIIISCIGYKADNAAASASSKSSKSKPGDTAQPAKQNVLPADGLLANQQFAGTTN